MTHPTTDAPAGGVASAVRPAVALASVLLLDVLRVWMPSVIFVHGRAGSTRAVDMGLFALGWVATGLVAAAVVRVVAPGVVVLAATGVLAAARATLQVWDGGGEVQLYAASLGWVAAMVLVGALAAAHPPRAVATGIALGLVADAALRAATGSVELTWIAGTTGTIAGLALVVATVVAVVLAAPAGPGGAPAAGRPAWPWLGLGPVLVLYGVIAGTPARIVAAVGLSSGAAAALVVAALALGAAWALSSVALPRAPAAALASALLIGGTVTAAPADGWVAVVGHVLLAAGLGGSLGILGDACGSSGRTRRSLAAAGSLALLSVVVFLYYVAYDVVLPFDNRSSLVATAVALAAVTLVAARRAPHRGPLRTRRLLPSGLAGAVVVAALGSAAATGATRASNRSTGDGLPVRVMLYNVHMGFDTAGRFDAAGLAAVVAEQRADVVVLNEADRGWFLNGSHDVLQLIADELGMTYAFAPAADGIWGNAILSRYPLAEARWEALPQGGAAMARSVLSAVVDVGAGERLGVVGTHLHHVEGDGDVRRPQAARVAAEARRMSDAGLPVVVMGDMNAVPGAVELEPYLEAGLEDVVTPSGEVRTFPSWDPVEHIDHVLTTSDLEASDVVVPRSTASDHLGVAVTLDRR